MVLTISRDDVKCVITPTVCCKRGCSNTTSTTRIRRTCDYHLNKSKQYRKNPVLREKQKLYMRGYYIKKRDNWSHYEWNKKKLDAVLKIQGIPHVKLMSVSDDYETITITLQNSTLPATACSPPSVLPQIQMLPDNPSSPKRNLCSLFDTLEDLE